MLEISWSSALPAVIEFWKLVEVIARIRQHTFWGTGTVYLTSTDICRCKQNAENKFIEKQYRHCGTGSSFKCFSCCTCCNWNCLWLYGYKVTCLIRISDNISRASTVYKKNNMDAKIGQLPFHDPKIKNVYWNCIFQVRKLLYDDANVKYSTLIIW